MPKPNHATRHPDALHIRPVVRHATFSKVTDQKQRKDYQELYHAVVRETKVSEKILRRLVDEGIVAEKPELDQTKNVLIADVHQAETKVLHRIERIAQSAEESVQDTKHHEKRIHEILEKIAAFAKKNRETDYTQDNAFTRRAYSDEFKKELDDMISELNRYGVPAPAKWRGKLAEYDSPSRILSRYEDLWEVTRREGIAAAIRREKFHLAGYRVKQFFLYLKKKIKASYDAIALNFVNFKNWIQAKLGGGRFEAMTQSTHLSSVHKSVTQSVKRLQKRYPGVNVAKALKEIKEHIGSGKFRDPERFYRQASHDSLKRIINADWEDPNTGLNLSKIAALVWNAVLDQAVYDEKHGKSQDPARDTQDRINIFLEYLWRAQREYNLSDDSVDDMAPAREACFPGTFNKIVESLDDLHPDVRIVRSKEVALKLAQEEVGDYYRDFPDQKALYDAMTTEAPTQKQQELLNNLKTHVRQKLTEVFEQTLDEREVQEILGNLRYINLPEPNNGRSEIKVEQEHKVAIEQHRDPALVEAIEWGRSADQDKYPGIMNKVRKLDTLDPILDAIDRGELNEMQRRIVQGPVFKYKGDLNNKEALKKFLEEAKEPMIKDLREAHAEYLSKKSRKEM